MASSTTKKVQIARFDRDSLSGFVNPATFLQPQGVEVLSLNGTALCVPYTEIKSVHFVREFLDGRIRLERTAFLARPKLDGLWVRLRFRDEETLEAVVPNNLLQLDPLGFTVIPPDFNSNNQRLFVPRAALIEVTVLGVVGSPLRRKAKAKPSDKDQIGLFE